MKLNSYLHFNGQCEAAFDFYAKCLEGKVEGKFPYGESPMAKHVPPEFGGKLMHASVVFNDQVLMGSDIMPDKYQKPDGFSVCVGVNEVGKAERIFKALSEGATIEMPIQETFWSARFGMLTDKFGIPWMVNCEKAA